MLLEFLLVSLATWRLSSLIIREAGPFHVLQKLRELVGVMHDDTGEPIAWPTWFPASLLSCIWCMSLWIGAGMFVFTFFAPHATWIIWPLAISAGAIMAERVVNR